jgi:hypothetical protein
MAEYALIVALVSIVTLVILLTMGKEIQNAFSNVVCAQGWSGNCATAVIVPAPTPTVCPTLAAPTLENEATGVPVYTFGPSDFGSSKRVVAGSTVRLLFDCPLSQASYRGVSGNALVPILWGNGYVVFVAAASGQAQITGSLDHSTNSALWHIDVTVVVA